ncbi:MAG: Mrp/NBP35 family ATP-binding protein [Alphaproteobacteria bacterium]|nr:Mrp/NBP35 family ATP-binding protein [Alphaproteobacteria bacterium]
MDKTDLKKKIVAILAQVNPSQDLGLKKFDYKISFLSENEGKITLVLEINDIEKHQIIKLQNKLENILKSISGIFSVSLVLTSEKLSFDENKSDKNIKVFNNKKIDTIKKIIAVASGKGGVGKSTTALNLAITFAVLGYKIGLLDADVYGPSQARMMGINHPIKINADKKIIPHYHHGIFFISMGVLVPENVAMIWRGPMVSGAIRQMLFDVIWGDLDILIIDLPPGTGDAQLTLAQQTILDGVIMVSTPQDIALLDVRKALNMFVKVDVPILGFVENMSYFECPHCHHHTPIFDHGGVEKEAKKLHLDLLGSIPLDISIRQASDQGYPLILQNPLNQYVKIYQKIAHRILQKLNLKDQISA